MYVFGGVLLCVELWVLMGFGDLAIFFALEVRLVLLGFVLRSGRLSRLIQLAVGSMLGLPLVLF